MRFLVEPIARKANREDKCSGRFFEGRYRCQPILDEPALAACLAYVDLNPIRAGIAETPEASRFTSVFERIQALLEAAAGDSDTAAPEVEIKGVVPSAAAPRATEPATPDSANGVAPRADWLSPFELASPSDLTSAASDEPAGGRRASNTGCLPMPFREYLQLLDWTGRQIRTDKRGSIPQELAPIFERLQLSSESWLNLVCDFRHKFRRAAGTPTSMMKEAQKRGCRKMQGIIHSR